MIICHRDTAQCIHNRKNMHLPPMLLQWVHTQEILSMHLPTCIFLFSVLLLWLRQVPAISNSPPRPPRLPIIGHLHYLGKLPHQSLQSLSQKYGPLMLLHLGFTPTLVVSSAEMAREIMKTHDTIFSSRPITKASKEILYSGKDVVFAPYGNYWRQMRKICAIDLFSTKRVEHYRYLTDEETANMVNKIKGSCLLKKNVNLSDIILVTSNNITSRNTVGKSLEQHEGGKLVKETVVHFGGFNFEDMFPCLKWIDVLTGVTGRMRKTFKQVHSLLDEVIDEHRKNDSEAAGKDLVDVLLKCEKDQTIGMEFTRENIRSVILDMFVAGTETSYTTVEWAMAELLSHPNAMNKLQEEVRRVVGEKVTIEEDDINQMNYLKCVIKETLRLHPPVVLSIPRESTASVNVKGYHIPAKTRVLVNLWAISRDPEIWDTPNEFMPERFTDSSVDYRGKHFQFIPFGAGRRACPGMTLGIISVESILANLLYWFNWDLAGGTYKVDLTEAFGLTVRLKSPLRLVPVSHFS